jgi:methylamine dehydrogenase light chain
MTNTTLFDRAVEGFTRRMADRSSRRSFLGAVAKVVGVGLMLPLLPVDRTGRRDALAAAAPTDGDTTDCAYWRYCAIDGYLCSCCGGNASTCPPGASPSPTSWVGSCQNPSDGQTYLIAYRDCCGKDSCGQCVCLRTEGEMPVYRPQLNNDIVWCFGAPTMIYHCSSAALIGRA